MELGNMKVPEYDVYKNSDIEEILIYCGREDLQMNSLIY